MLDWIARSHFRFSFTVAESEQADMNSSVLIQPLQTQPTLQSRQWRESWLLGLTEVNWWHSCFYMEALLPTEYWHISTNLFTVWAESVTLAADIKGQLMFSSLVCCLEGLNERRGDPQGKQAGIVACTVANGGTPPTHTHIFTSSRVDVAQMLNLTGRLVSRRWFVCYLLCICWY